MPLIKREGADVMPSNLFFGLLSEMAVSKYPHRRFQVLGE